MFLKPFRIIAIYFILLLLGIPWYWPKDSVWIIFGLPAWVFVAILISFLTSVFTAYLYLMFSWNSETDVDE